MRFHSNPRRHRRHVFGVGQPLVLCGVGTLCLALAAGWACRAEQDAGQSSAHDPITSKVDCDWAEDLDNWQESGAPLFIADANLLTPYRMRLDGVSPHSENDLEFTPDKAQRGGLRLAVLEVLVTGGDLAKPSPFEELVRELETITNELGTNGVLSIAQSVSESAAALAPNASERPISILLGVENLAPVGSELDRLETLRRNGVRLATPIHSRPNLFGDSSYSQERPHQGLSELGERLIQRMNQLGLIIDVSHMSDQALMATTRATVAPVVASHSGARHFTPGWERNLSDDGIRAVAATGGVVHVPFSGSFLNQQIKDAEQPVWDHVEGQGLSINSLEGRIQARAFRAEHRTDYASVSDVIAQIDYIVDLAGIDHVGFGSSFDGSGQSMAGDIKDSSGYPHLIRGLCQAGYSPEAVRKISGGNFIRVWNDVEQHALRSEHQSELTK